MLLEKCYQLLGVNIGATEMEIKSAYRQKAKFYHPDVNKNANAKTEFQVLNEAYQYILLNLNSVNNFESIEVEQKEEYKKYGSSVKNSKFDSKYNYRKVEVNENEVKLNRSPYDKYIYWFFLMLGINMLVFGAIDVIKSKSDENINYTGLLAAVPFLVILIIGWNVIKKTK
jgi:preprotein translocase subunit Sec63